MQISRTIPLHPEDTFLSYNDENRVIYTESRNGKVSSLHSLMHSKINYIYGPLLAIRRENDFLNSGIIQNQITLNFFGI